MDSPTKERFTVHPTRPFTKTPVKHNYILTSKVVWFQRLFRKVIVFLYQFPPQAKTSFCIKRGWEVYQYE